MREREIEYNPLTNEVNVGITKVDGDYKEIKKSLTLTKGHNISFW